MRLFEDKDCKRKVNSEYLFVLLVDLNPLFDKHHFSMFKLNKRVISFHTEIIKGFTVLVNHNWAQSTN